MAYQWRIPGIVPVDAQTAGDELDRIYRKDGKLEPAKVVDESRPEQAPLHPCFEWDDAVAAEKYRENQAGGIIRNITVSCEPSSDGNKEVRAFVHVERTYHPISVVLNDQKKADELLQSALRDLKAFREKYETLTALRPVFDSIDSLAV